MVPENEYHPYYRNYIEPYASSGKSIVEVLEESQNRVNDVLKDLPKDKEGYIYAANKWTIKELMQHVIDAERIFNYRALRFARNDQTPLQGFDQNDFNLYAEANQRELKSILKEFHDLRSSTIALYKSFDQNALIRIGKASGNPMSVRALGYLTSGHVEHHIRIFKERYLS